VPPKRLILFLIAAFCRLEKSLSHSEQMGWLVGAVGIENKDDRNFKELRGIRGNAKSLKRSNRARKGILIAPSKLPRISRCCVPFVGFRPLSKQKVGFGPNLAARMASRRRITEHTCKWELETDLGAPALQAAERSLNLPSFISIFVCLQ
jgi:hypothetical protein